MMSSFLFFAHLAGAVEYTNCFSAEREDSPPPPHNECPRYDTKSDGELWGMRSTPSLPLLPGLLWPRVTTPLRVLSMSQIELNCILMLN